MTYSKINASQVWVFDCETTNKEYREKYKRNDVWVIAGKNLLTKQKKIFVNLNQFFKWVEKMSLKEKIYVYFHNLKFDGSYKISWYNENNWNYININKFLSKDYSVLLDERKTIFYIKAKHGDYITEFRDSSKLIPKSIKEIGKELGFEKGEIDHTQSNKIYNKVSDIPQDKLNYVWRDVDILLEILSWIYKYFKLDFLTVASLGENLITCFLNREWDKLNPLLLKNIPQYILEQPSNPYMKRNLMGDRHYQLLDDEYFKKHIQYFTAGINWQYEPILNKELKEDGEICDCNSAYPHACKGLIPYGRVLLKKPKGIYRTFYEILIIKFKSKGINIPSIQEKKSWKNTKFLENSNNPFVWGYWDTRLEQIKIDYDIKYKLIKKWYFKAGCYLKPIVEWLEEWKLNPPNPAIRLFIKILLNSGLFGKQIQKEILNGFDIIDDEKKGYTFTHNKSIGFKRSPHIASAITSDNQVHLLNATRKNYKDELGNVRIRDVDTDCLRVKGKIVGLELDDKKIGAWKIEYRYNRIKVLKGKCYIACKNDIIEDDKRAMAGVSDKIKNSISIKDFYLGKKVFKPVAIWYKGGIHIDEVETTL